MKKSYKYFLILFILIVSCVYFYKWKQKEFLGLSEPKPETVESIINYAKKNKIEGEILISKDDNSHQILKKYFDYGYLYVLDQNFNLIDCNIESYGGRCFQDIQSDICKGIEIKPRKFSNKINGKKIMDTLLQNSKCITNENPISYKKYNRIYLYTWVKYSKSCIDKSSIQFIKCLKQDKNNKALILTINTDIIKY